MHNSMPLCWQIKPMPDFLLDHTLTEEQSPARMKEIVSRWVQLVGSLWRWHDRATFALRFTSNCRQVRAFLLATCVDEDDRPILKDDIAVLLRSHGIPAEVQQGKSAEDEESFNWNLGGDAVLAEVRQHQNSRLWKIPQNAASNPRMKREFAWLPENYFEFTPTLFPWWAPGGPFLLPIEKLVSQPVPCSITAYISPTKLTENEWDWLAFLARTAQSHGDFQEQAIDQALAQRKVDPAAALAGRMAMANLRRLSDKPFLVNVQCAAGSSNESSVRSIAGSIESIVYETPFDRPAQEDNRLPSGADVEVFGQGKNQAKLVAENQYRYVTSPAGNANDPLKRIPYLVDARGAATVFRLPINVRGGVPGIRVSQRPPDFHPGPRNNDLERDHILIGELHQGGVASVHRNQFTKHALITGFTGSGKTVTVKSIVHQLHASGVPVLVIESAKHEYRSLLNVSAFSEDEEPLWVFTAGNESCAPVRLNPFELLPGIRVEAHVSRLQTCFEGALPPIGPLASMIGEAIVDVYERRGWRLTDQGPEIGEVIHLSFPTMIDFYKRMSELTSERGYEGEVRSNVSAAVLGRIKPLTIGTKGMMFQSDRDHRIGEPRKESLISEIFKRSAVIELNDLNIDDKAMLTMFLLTFLREHRERHASADGSLVHAAVVEEAHNILENVESTGGTEGGGADTRFKAVQAFSSLLTEIRALGQSLIIVDQSPEKLAPDALRNTNIQIAHQLRDSKDRDSISRAMIMEQQQRDYLGKLVPGQAAMFVTGLERATFVQVPKYRGQAPKIGNENSIDGQTETPAPTDATVQLHMSDVTGHYRNGPFGSACRQCRVRLTCDHRRSILAASSSGVHEDQFARIADRYRRDRSVSRPDTVQQLVQISNETAKKVSPEPNESQVYCAFVHLWHRDPFNWTEPFPQCSYETLVSVLRKQDSLMGVPT